MFLKHTFDFIFVFIYLNKYSNNIRAKKILYYYELLYVFYYEISLQDLLY
jgi:hypothetical protein